jgi:hypothetical protein
MRRSYGFCAGEYGYTQTDQQNNLLHFIVPLLRL